MVHELTGVPESVRVTIKNLKRNPIVGKIGFLQERGAKARIIANPLRIHQVAMSKLQHWLEKCAKVGLPWDCTFDQGKGVRWMQQKLREGKRLVCTDLSAFTDNYPLSVTIDTLKWMGPQNEEFLQTLKLMEALSRGSWSLSNRHRPLTPTVKWTKGSPMGLNGNFLANGLTHGFQLRSCEIQKGLEDCFCVVGDDVVMTTDIAGRYQRLSADLGVPLNDLKSLTSDTVGEFVSRLASKTRVLKTYKFPAGERLFSSAKPLEILVKYGPKARRLIPKKLRPEVNALASLPKDFGGLGWKPPKYLSDWDLNRILVPKEKPVPIPDILPVQESYIKPGYFSRGKVPHSSDGKKHVPLKRDRAFSITAESYANRLLSIQAAFGPLGNFCQGDDTPQNDIAYDNDADWDELGVFDFLKEDRPNTTVLVSKEPYYIGCVRCENRFSTADEQEDNLSSIDLQWEILHVNSNLYSFDLQRIRDFREEALKGNKKGLRTQLFEEEWLDPIGDVRKRIRGIGQRYFEAVNNFRWFMFWTKLTQFIVNLKK
jgi:hypothetical protein